MDKRFLARRSSGAIQVRERTAGIHQQIEVSGKFFIRQELIRPGAEILRWTRVDQHHVGSCIGKALRLLNKNLNLAVAVGALIARVSAKHDQHHWTFRNQFGKPDTLTLRSGEGEIRSLLAD